MEELEDVVGLEDVVELVGMDEGVFLELEELALAQHPSLDMVGSMDKPPNLEVEDMVEQVVEEELVECFIDDNGYFNFETDEKLGLTFSMDTDGHLIVDYNEEADE